MGLRRVDDLNGSAAEQVTFGLNGVAYVIDLGAENVKKLERALQPFLVVAQEYGKLPAPPGDTQTPRRPQSGVAATATIRAWANVNGYQLPSRGRIPAHVVAAFEEDRPA